MASYIGRRKFLATLGGAAAAWPLAARAQQPAKPTIGFLGSSSAADRTRLVTAFRQAVREAGYVEGQNLVIEYRWAQDQYDRLADLAADLVRRRVAVIAAHDTLSAIAAKAATTTIPIVFVTGANPVRDDLVASLNRPGGNVTGVSFIGGELGAKQLGLLRELRPGAARIAVLVDPKWPTTEGYVSEIRAAALTIGQQIEFLYASTGRDIDTVFADLAQKPVDALLVGPSPLANNRRVHLVTLATYHRVLAIYFLRDFAEVGGLMSYGTSIADANRWPVSMRPGFLRARSPATCRSCRQTSSSSSSTSTPRRHSASAFRQGCSPSPTR